MPSKLSLRLSTPLLLAALAAPAIALTAAPSVAMAQGQAVFAEPFVQLLPTGPIYADGGTPVTVHALLLAPNGTPYIGLKPKVSAKDGQASDWTELGGGLYAFTFVPPKRDSEGATTISIRGKTTDKLTIDSTLSVSFLAPLPNSMTITANPSELVLTQDKSVSLSIQLGGAAGSPEVGAKLKVITSAGQIENLTYLGGGLFTALYTPPPQTYPHVAIITVVDERSPETIYGTHAIKLVGKTDFPVSGQPGGATVLVRIGDRDFGPYTADAAGNARVPLVVPPGNSQATIISVVNGTKAEAPLDLQLPQTRRVSFFPTYAAIPGDPQGAVTLRVAVTTPTGLADPNAAVAFSSNAGQLSPAKHEGQGVFSTVFTPALNAAGGTATISANINGEAGALGATLDVPVAPARAATVTHTTEPSKLSEGATSFKVFTRISALDGTGLGGRELVFNASGAQAQGVARDLRSGDYETVFATTGTDGVSVTGAVAAPVTGNPIRHVVVVPGAERVINDGKSGVPLQIFTVDAFGYPVPNAPVTLKLSSGDGQLARQVSTDARGMALVFYTAGTAAGVVSVKATAGDTVGYGGLLQLPAGVAQGLDLPASGSASTVAMAQRFGATTATLVLPRQGSASVAQTVNTAAATGAAGALTSLMVSASPSQVAPGGSVTLTIQATDANGRPVTGEKVTVLATGGTAQPVQNLGGGSYSTTLTVPAGATGQAMIIASNSNGSVTGAATVPIAGTAWGQTTAPDPVTTPPVTTMPVTTAPVTTTTTIEQPKAPREPGDFPFARARVGFMAGSYGYSQTPGATEGPLWPETVNVSAIPVGFTVDAQAFLPMFEYVGAELQVRSGFYAVDWLGDGSAVIDDLLPNVSLMAAGRYPIDMGASRLSIGGKAGLLYGDFITYQQPSEDELTWEALPLAGLGLGAEIAYDLGDRFYFEADYVLGLRGTPFSHNVGLDLGVGITGPLYLSAGLDWSTRSTEVVAGANSVLVGTLEDSVIVGIIGPGVQF